MHTTAHERVAREDLVLFINACFACTGQAEFYTDARGQAVSIDFLHEYIQGNYRRLYARTLAAGINHFNQARVIANLLARAADADPGQRREEGRLIAAALRLLPPQRALRVLRELRLRRVNNRRTRAIIRGYLLGRPDPVFDAVKYRALVRGAAAHAHLKLPGEIGPFLFQRMSRTRAYATPLFETLRQARYARSAALALPYTVAEGLAASRGIGREDLLKKGQAQMTAAERLRLQGAAQRQGIEIEVDLSRVPLTRLAIYWLGLELDERRRRRDEFAAALQASARRALRRAPLRLGRVAAVLDRSHSSSGSEEKRRRPLAVALAVSCLLREAAAEYRAHWTLPVEDEVLVTARGQTGLGAPLLDALEDRPDLVVIVSDGYENDPPGAAGALAQLYRERVDRERRTCLVHVNPVFDAEQLMPRVLGAALPTVGLRDAEDLLTMLGFARFADGAAPLEALERYLEARVAELLGAGEVRA